MNEETSGMRIGVAWYTPETYAALLETADDRAELPPTYEAWLTKARGVLFAVRSRGQNPEQVFIDVPEALRWCKSQGLAFDGQGRAEFVRQKVRTTPPVRPLRF